MHQLVNKDSDTNDNNRTNKQAILPACSHTRIGPSPLLNRTMDLVTACFPLPPMHIHKVSPQRPAFELKVLPSGICRGWSGIGTGFSQSTSVPTTTPPSVPDSNIAPIIHTCIHPSTMDTWLQTSDRQKSGPSTLVVRERTEIDPTMKDHTAVFALQLLKHIRYQHLCDQ